MTEHICLQMINKFMSLSEENIIKRNYKRAIWQFYNAYNLSLPITNNKIKYHKNNKIVMNFMKSQDNIDSKLFKKLQKNMRKDENIIYSAISILQQNKDLAQTESKYYPKGTTGMLAFEFE